MAVESAQYISELVKTNPQLNDPVAQGYLQLQVIKSVLLNSFPAISAKVTATPTQLNALSAMFGTNPGASITLQDGVSGDPEVVLEATSTGGDLAVTPSGGTKVTALSFDSKGAVTCPVSTDTPNVQQNGSTLVPKGIITLWSGAGDAVPAGWALCDGTQGTPDLRGAFVVGAGATPQDEYQVGTTGGLNTIDGTTQTAGSHNHGGLTGQGGGQQLNLQTVAAGSHAHGTATGGVALTADQIPPLSYQYPVYAPQNAGGSGNNFGGATGGDSEIYWHFVSGQTQGGGQTHIHAIHVDGEHQHGVTVPIPTFQLSISYDGTHDHTYSFDNRPPYYALCFIMKL